MTHKKLSSVTRLRQDYLRLKRDPVPYIEAEPLPSNILEWHYVVKGPEDSPYYGGYYHGTLQFPREYPFRPPAIYMITPNGRFKTNTRLCLSISDFHPDTWNPAWSVSTILTGLLSFMLESSPTLGSVLSSNREKQEYARASLSYNLNNDTFRELFPDTTNEINARLKNFTCGRDNATATQYENVTIKCTCRNPNRCQCIRILRGEVNNVPDVNYNQINNNDNNVMEENANVINDDYWFSIGLNVIILVAVTIFGLVVMHMLKTLNME